MFEPRELTLLSVILRVLVAAILSGIIGLERGMKNRPAGLRTYMLVCVGSCLIMLTNQYLFQVSGAGDPMRLGAQVVSGIGFLGAGTIIVTKHNQIKGLTTAAGLWASAGVGLALGVGFYEAAIVAGFAVRCDDDAVVIGFDRICLRNGQTACVVFHHLVDVILRVSCFDSLCNRCDDRGIGAVCCADDREESGIIGQGCRGEYIIGDCTDHFVGIDAVAEHQHQIGVRLIVCNECRTGEIG